MALVLWVASREWQLIAHRYPIEPVKTIDEIRYARLLELLALPDFRTIQAFADRIERSHSQVSQWKNRTPRKNKEGQVIGLSNIDSDSARHIEAKAGKPRGWMDNDPAFDSGAASDAVGGERAYAEETDAETIPGALDPLAHDEIEKRLLVAFRHLLAEQREVQLAELERTAQTNLELGQRWLKERMGVTGSLSDEQVRDGFRRAAENNAGPAREQLLNPGAPAPSARRGPPTK